jgi:hypothetical protein
LEVRLRGGGFADDKKPVEKDIERLNRWLARSAEFGFFHGVDVRPDKCEGHATKVGEGGLATPVQDLPALVIPTGPDSVLMPIQLVEASQSIRTLGEQGNALLLWAEAVDEIREISEAMGRMFKARVPREVAQKLWKACVEAKVSYKLFMATVSEQELQEVMGTAFRAFKNSMGLPVSAPNALTYAFGFGDSWTDLNVRRMVAIVRNLGDQRGVVKQVLEGGIHWLQMWVGTEQPVLETDFSEVRGWNGTWIGRVHAWMASVNLRLSGGRPMAMLRHNDRAIVDLFEDEWEKAVVGEGNYILEKWRVSEMLHEDGANFHL